jgi:hypothetical protein
MPAYEITYNHSHMRTDFRGSAIKTAHTPKAAAECLGTYSAKEKTIVAKKGVRLTKVEINEIKTT